VKATQGSLQKTITWTKKSKNEKQEKHVLRRGYGFGNLKP
jgi:hypothetical protein